MTRCEACLCGGVIYADSIEFSAVAVQLHNASVTHQIWRAIREGRLSAEGNTTVASRDKLVDDAIQGDWQAQSRERSTDARPTSSPSESSSQPPEAAEGSPRATSERFH